MAVPTCGQEISEDLTLDGDLTCDSGPALVVTADGVTLDLGGHTVSATGSGAGSAPGILLRNVHRATVRNGTVTGFGAGVVVDGGGDNLVQNVTAQDNLGAPGGELGDGIVVRGSNGNRIEGNTTVRNGPYSGISVLGPSQHNNVRHNIVADNNMLHTGDPGAGRQAMGIRIEGPGADHNLVEANTVTGSGADGIVVLATCTNPDSTPPCQGSPPNRYNRVLGNTTMRNGTSGRGNGVKLFDMPAPAAPAHTTIAGNVANANTTCGIGVDSGASEANKMTGNSAHGNGEFDGYDGNTDPACGTNSWQRNDFGRVNQTCVTGQVVTGDGQFAEVIEVDQAMVERRFRENLAATPGA